MGVSENSNQVSQSGNEAAGDIVGRDKSIVNQTGTIINIHVNTPLDIDDLIIFLKANTGFNDEFIRSFINSSPTQNYPIRSIDHSLFLLEIIKRYREINTGYDANREYDKIISENIMESYNVKIRKSIRDAENCVKRFKFDKAHLHWSNILESLTPSHNNYELFYREYLISGLICYSRKNDINGLKSLLHRKAEITSKEESDIEYLISMIYQEIFTRDIDLKSLSEVVSTLEKLYSEASEFIKPSMSLSLGLAYRRLGERTDTIYLRKAISIFQEGLELNRGDKKMEIELKDQMATAHIRIFESKREKVELSEAETLLIGCLKSLDGPMDPRDYRLKPRILNNIGNIYKQRCLSFKEPRSATKALSFYEKAEEYWKEKTAGYDWALLRKNMAETKYALGRITFDSELILDAIKDSIKSVKYRTLKSSPYQWGKTVNIVFLAVILLNEMKLTKVIQKDVRRTIKAYSNAVINDDRWRENISAEFVLNAKLIQKIIG